MVCCGFLESLCFFVSRPLSLALGNEKEGESQMKSHLLKAFAVAGLVFAVLVNSATAGYEETIPPEILRQYDPAIVKNQKPIVVCITQPMIWGLRDKPDQGGDIYSSLGWNPGDCSPLPLPEKF